MGMDSSTPNMIIVQILGGLGNQMFQYAAARRLSLRAHLPLKLDISGFVSYKRRRFALAHLCVRDDHATPDEVRSLRGWAPRVQRRMPQWARQMIASGHVIEPHYHFSPEILGIRRPVYLTGFWQSERYFSDVEDVIRKDFAVSDPPTEKNRAILEQIRSAPSVAVHVRRGDYLQAKAGHGTCPAEYYRTAMAEMVQRCGGTVRFYVFSDDIEWARENLDRGATVSYVDHNGPDEDYEDLRLMTSCTHHVIANSTFSWWGAWLGSATNKIVIAPKRWFAGGAHDTRDLYPPGWTLM